MDAVYVCVFMTNDVPVLSISPCRQYRCAQEVILNQVHTYLELSV